MRDKPNTVASIGPIVKNGPPGPKMIAIPAEVAKNSRVQVVVFTEAELKIRDRRDNINKEISLPRKFVFSEGGETGHLTDVKQSWTRFCIRARLEDLQYPRSQTQPCQLDGEYLGERFRHQKRSQSQRCEHDIDCYARANQAAELAARQVAHKTMLELGRSESVVRLEKKAKEQEF